MTAEAKPLLAVDIDGVISIFASESGFDAQMSQPGRFEYRLIDGIPHCISLAAGDRLRRMRPHFEMFWASGWEDRANDHLPDLLGVPELPWLKLEGTPSDDRHWKLEPIDRYAANRPLAWIDDALDRECFEWARSRLAPTLLLETDPRHGFEETHAEVLLQWVDSGFILEETDR